MSGPPEPGPHPTPPASPALDLARISEPGPGGADPLLPGPVPVPAASRLRPPEPRLVDLMAAGALYAALLFVTFTLMDPDVLARGESEAPVFMSLQVLDDGILMAVALLFGRLRFPGSWQALGFRRVRLKWLGIGVGSGVGAAALAWAISVVLDYWGWPPPFHPVESVLGAAKGPRDLVVILLAVTGPVPLAEETFFRGFAYRLLRARFGALAALAATSLSFALVHGLEVSAWLPVLPVGVVFAVLAERSGSLWPAVIGHAAVNALAIVIG